jgi:hypothetical protein
VPDQRPASARPAPGERPASGENRPVPITITRWNPDPMGESGMAGSDAHYDPNKLGWGFAAAIIVLAIVANVTAFSIHEATYLKPDKAPAAESAH